MGREAGGHWGIGRAECSQQLELSTLFGKVCGFWDLTLKYLPDTPQHEIFQMSPESFPNKYKRTLFGISCSGEFHDFGLSKLYMAGPRVPAVY